VKTIHMLHAAIAHWRLGQVLLLWGNLGRYTPTPDPTPRFVSQSLDALLQKSLHPFVDKATGDPDHGSNVGDRYSIGEEEDNPGTSE
jgi:hypothetical protein